MTIDEVKSYYGSFDCEVLTSNPQNEMEIRDFTCHIRNNTLENYLKTDAWKEDIGEKDPIMTVEYKPEEWNAEYDIVNTPEQFHLYVDDEMVEDN